MTRTLLLLPWLAGCVLGLDPMASPIGGGDLGVDSGGGNGGGDDGGGDDGGGDDGGGDGGGGTDIDITDISPAWGISSGGERVTITGGPFDSSTVISFGGEEASVTRADSAEIVVDTPSYSGITAGEGKATVNVTAENDDGGEGRATNAFTFYEDGEGKAGVIGSIDWYHFAGGYWSSTDYGAASVTFIAPPTDLHTWDLYAPSADECAGLDYDISDYFGDVYSLDMGASSIQLSFGSQRITLQEDTTYGGYANASDLTAAQVPTSQAYDLEEVDGDFAPEAFAIGSFARSAGSFTVSNPNIGGSAPPTVTQSALNIRWSGGGGRRIIISALLVSSAGDLLDAVYCQASDDGDFTVPSSAWSTTWARGNYVYLYIGNAVEVNGTLPYNNAETRVAGIYWNVGAGLVP